jgi:hypothetical protein
LTTPPTARPPRRPPPADGTLVQGLPSRQSWLFGQGQRLRTPAAPAVQVDDAGLSQFPLAPCVVPKLGHRTLGQVRTLLGQTNCRLGRVVKRHRPRRGRQLHVLRQFPGANAHRTALAAVAVTLG